MTRFAFKNMEDRTIGVSVDDSCLYTGVISNAPVLKQQADNICQENGTRAMP